MKEKKTTIPPAGAVKPTTANKKPLLMMALPIIVAVLLLFVPVPEGLPPYAWHYFAIFVGVIVGLIFEPLPGAVIGITGVVVIALCSQWLLFSPDQMAAPGFKMAGASFKWAVSGFGNSTVWLIFGAFMFAAGYDKTQFGRRLALILVKYLGRRSLTLGYAITFADLLLAPFTPSNTARSGGTIYPIIANLPPLYGSKPNDPSARKIGSYLMWVAITAACITSSMFLSALAPNLLALALVKSIVGINISWGTWFIAFLPLGILLILAMPLLAYWFYPPEVKVNNEVPLWAARELEKLGKLSRNEILLLAFYLLHYLFASTTAHTTALLPAMLTIASTIPGMNMEVFVLLMVTSLGVMGIITPYGTGPSPIYYGSGYLPTKDYWRLGTIFGAIFLAALLLIGYPWMSMMF
ncbi:TPA: DASS family sodium-coupled anion symporter [Klebsiella pneumoniae]